MPIDRIVIVGGGAAAWLCALAVAAKSTSAITVIDTGGVDDSLGLPVAIEASLPSVADLCHGYFLSVERDRASAASMRGLGSASGRRRSVSPQR